MQLLFPGKTKLIVKLMTIKPFRLLWLSIVSSIVFTQVIVMPMSILFHGKVRPDFFITGVVCSFFVSMVICYLLINLIKHVRESEARYHHLFEVESDAILLVDCETYRILEANPAALKLYGYTREEFLLLNADNVSGEPDKTLQGISTGQTQIPFRWHCKKDGTVFPVEIACSSFEYQGRNVHVAAIRDITERNRAEQQIKQSLKEKEALLREIHHRVKNNMAVVSSLLSLEAGKIKDATVRALFDESQRRVRSMALVHEKLYMTKDLSSINFQDYIKSIVSEIISLYRINTSAITTEINIEGVELDLESAVPCGLIINELLTNVFKHAFPDDRSGILSVHFSKSDGTYTLAIKDNGVGLPEGFDYNGESTLGLRLVKVLAGQLGGTLQIKSDKGTEAVVTFKIPDVI